MAKFTDETRRRLATGWDPRVCTLREYARQNGISERAIRGWRARFRGEEGSAVLRGKVAVPEATVHALHTRLEDLEAAADSLQASIAAVRAILDSAAAACRPAPAGTGADRTATPEPAVQRKPVPTNGFFWG